MEEAIPTPYDIVPIPQFPFEANLTWFLIIFVITALIISAFVLVTRHAKRKYAHSSQDVSKSHMEHCKELLQKNALSRMDLDFLADTSRHLANQHFKENLLACSKVQLDNLVSQVEGDTRKDLVRLFARLEEIRYQSGTKIDEEVETLERVFKMIDRLRDEEVK